MKHLAYSLLLLCWSGFQGCTDAVDKALSELNNLEKIITERTGDLTTELEKWRADLPKEARSLINDDIEKLSQDIIGSTGKETRCTVDFLRDRFKQSVENIKAKLTGGKVVYQKPCFCTINMPMINPNADEKTLQTLSFYGYDFNNPDSSKKLMKVVLVGDSTSREINENFIGRTSNYQVVINVADILPEIASNKYHKIKIFWNGDSTGLSESVLSQWKPDIKFDPFQPRSFSWFPPHTAGDGDFDTDPGNWANGAVQLEMRVNGENIEARLFYDVMEFGGDNTRVGIGIDPKTNQVTEATAWGPWTPIYTNINPKYELTGFSPGPPARYPFKVVDHGPKDYHQGGTAVEEFKAFVDEKGDDVANCHVDVIFNPMHAVLKQKQPVRN